MLDGLKCLLIHSQFSLEDRSSSFVHDSYEGSRRNVFLVFLAPGDFKCFWDCGSITIITSCFLWSVLSHMLLRSSLLWSNNKELLWVFSLFKIWIPRSEWLVSILEANQGKDRLTIHEEQTHTYAFSRLQQMDAAQGCCEGYRDDVQGYFKGCCFRWKMSLQFSLQEALELSDTHVLLFHTK